MIAIRTPSHGGREKTCNIPVGGRLQLQWWPAITLKSESPIRVDYDHKLAHILLLLSQGITHAVSGLGNVRECDFCRTRSDSLGWAFDLFVCNLDVHVKIHAVAGDSDIHVENEGHSGMVFS